MLSEYKPNNKGDRICLDYYWFFGISYICNANSLTIQNGE